MKRVEKRNRKRPILTLKDKKHNGQIQTKRLGLSNKNIQKRKNQKHNRKL